MLGNGGLFIILIVLWVICKITKCLRYLKPSEEIFFLDLEKSVIDDINLIRSHESVHDHIEIKGFIFDLEESLLTPI